MVEAFSVLGLSAAVLHRDGKALAANALFARLMPEALAEGAERVILPDIKADQQFEARLGALNEGLCELSGEVRDSRATEAPSRGKQGKHSGEQRAAAPIALEPIPIAASRGMAPMLVHLMFLPVLSEPQHDRLALMVVTSPSQSKVPAIEILQGLFKLTPSEARLAYEIGHGRSLKDASDNLSISNETVRTVLKRIFAKCGVSRQSELAALLARLSLG